MALFVAVFTAFSLSFFNVAAAAVAFPRTHNNKVQDISPYQYDLHSFLPEQRAPQSGSYQRCQVAEYDRVQCGEPGITGDNCETINCCFDGQQCYYGLAVTIQCTKDAQFVLVVAKDSTLPRLSLDSITFMEGSDGVCGAADSNAAFAIFQFPVTACGTRMMDVGGHLVYENKMSSSYEVGVGPRGAITRDSHYELSFQCRYSLTSVEALLVEVNTIPPPIPIAVLGPLRVELRLANGHCVTKGCVKEQVAYTSYYSEGEYPVTKVLREPVYVEVRLLERSDPNVVLTLQRCWATSMPDSNSLPQWDLLVNGCPYQDDRYLTNLIPVNGSPEIPYPSHYKRFVFKMFTFVDPTSTAPLVEKVFIHCSTAVCHPSKTNSCKHNCGKQRRDVSAAERYAPKEPVVSSKEVLFIKA
uniref:Zona pellucida sperm-binding protein 4 n=1 Tax=Astyanax mexicanus TaxID=7994 RepID=W5KAE9_ASTMX